MTTQSLKQKTAGGLFWGGIGQGLQQLLNLLFGIVLARLLTDTDYGMVGMLAIFTAVTGALQESGFVAALANKTTVTHRDYNAVFWFSLLTGATLYLILFCSAPLIADFFQEPALIPLSRYLFLGSLISSTATAHSAILFRQLKVKERTFSQFPALIVSGLVGIWMAYNGFAYWGIATQSLLYIAIVNGCYWYFSGWRPTWTLDFQPLREMVGFSHKLLLTNLFLQINNNLLSALIGRYSKADVGNYTQAAKWNQMGHATIGGMLSAVAQPVLAQTRQQPGHQQQVLRKMLRFAAFLSFPAMLGLALISDEFIRVTITEKWLPAVPLLQTLCLWGACVPIQTLYIQLLLSRGKSDVYLWNMVCFGALQLVLMLLIYPYGMLAMVRSFVALNICWLLVWHRFVKRETGLRYRHALLDVAPFAGLAALSMLAAAFLTHSLTSPYLLLLSRIGLGATFYIGALWLCRATILRESISYIKERLSKR